MPTILIVDDEPAVLALLRLVFSKAGYEVRTAANAMNALQLFAADTVDVILSDVDMPGMDGHCLVRRVVGVHPDVRVVLMSALSEHCGECPFAERCRMIRKPFIPQEAKAAIASALNEGGPPLLHP